MAVVDETVVDRAEDDQKERLCCFGNSISVNIFYRFLDYRPLNGNDDIVKESIMECSLPDPWAKTLLTCQAQTGKRGWPRRKVNANTFKEYFGRGGKPAYCTDS